MQNKVNHICFIIAMAGEAQPLIDHFKLELQENVFPDYLPMKVFQNTYKKVLLSLVVNGHDQKHGIDNIATQPATLSTFLTIDRLNPELIINVGTAGGFREKGLKIGDVVIAQGKAWYHDRRIPIPEFRAYGLGGYDLADQSALIKRLQLKAGVIATGNSFDYTKLDQEIMNSLEISIKDMEAAAIAWVCDMASVPLIILKGITDFVGLNHPNQEQFVQNFKLTTENVKKAVIRLVEQLTM